MPTKSTAMAPEDEELSLSSEDDSSSSEESEVSTADSLKDPTEDRCDACWRQSAFVGIAVLGAFVIFSIFILMLRQDNIHFESTFKGYANALRDAATLQDKSTQESMEFLSESITMQAVNEGSKWPYVTAPFFQVQAEHTRVVSGADSVIMSPIVSESQRPTWEQYSVLVADEVLAENSNNLNSSISDSIFTLEIDEETGDLVPAAVNGTAPYNPVWQTSPLPNNASAINFDMLSNDKLLELFNAMHHTRTPVVSPIMSLNPMVEDSTYEHAESAVFSPILEDLSQSNTTKVVANLVLIMSWETYLLFLRENHMNGADYVLTNTCGQIFSLEVNENGELGTFEVGDRHEEFYEDMVEVVPVMTFLHTHFNTSTGLQACGYNLRVYPSQVMRDDFKSGTAPIAAGIAGGSFVVVLAILYFMDRRMHEKHRQIIKSVEKSNAIIASLFPSNVRDRLFGGGGGDDAASKNSHGSRSKRSFGFRLRTYLTEGEDADGGGGDSNPIADLFPECTVLFADIVGFTAWSSMREPAQVFTLLETLYSAFDELAKELGVFKVETIGDCYVAVTGLPDPREDHAVVMAIFARECLKKMQVLTKDLEVKLGPDTGDLSMRFGLHSGPVTAGVLRGERSRFQLFGDTVNTAARIESTGHRGKIHLSQESAELIMAAQKAHWVQPREDKVTAKGKGELTTYWLGGGGPSSYSSTTSSRMTGPGHPAGFNGDSARAPLPKILRKKKPEKPEIEARRATDVQKAIERAKTAEDPAKKQLNFGLIGDGSHSGYARKILRNANETYQEPDEPMHSADPTRIYTDEVKEVITLPKFDSRAAGKVENAESIVLGYEVVEQLHDFVRTISTLYRENSFHNFEHASHVTMSVVKLLSRIVAPDLEYPEESVISSEKKRNRMLALKLHDHTYGITSDPLTQFAVVFSALIHDVDHTGVPNNQLIIEDPDLGKRFRNESVAEQHSVACSWDLLMQPKYNQLRRAIYRSDAERERFLQLVINCVMATDIVNPQLKELRNARWDKAFKVGASADDHDINRKATIVMEHLIQASDVSHTMQHWHIYRKWNERLFREMYSAYREGRSEKNPADFWAKGEVGFFDFYIIPLAKKLKECGVFGVSSDEYLQYAVKNRNEWEMKGAEVVETMVESIELEYDDQ
ncbi:Receptor-type guanylate cyclase gcy [Seminavis robusta]|uniref:Receptor-type guanylate cyclase gcy n=1 Tax=Seminavis robusta TaxID=568900 RepID=A0A9N8H655_9STRA|nr:Receptor-type guanylate cyclase gcy [Seminavis robusta]|eukprot:Sro135_g063750.1 Receptor-type guanylate cyclase gcy (1153) ;mRNA; f:41541-46458